MTWKNIKLIFLREVRDQLRDRRTLFMVAVLPILLYPALGIGMMQMTLTFTEQPRTVVVLGAEDLPPPPLIDPANPGRFVGRFFVSPDDAAKLDVLTEQNVLGNVESKEQQAAAGMVALAQKNRPQVEELAGTIRARRDRDLELTAVTDRLQALKQTADRTEAQNEAIQAEEARGRELVRQIDADKVREAAMKLAIDQWFSESKIQVLIVVPKGFKEKVQEIDEQLKTRQGNLRDIDQIPRPIVLQNSADEKSQVAYRRVKEAMRDWESEVLQARLSKAGLPSTLSSPVNAVEVDMARPDDMAANLWSKLFPAMLVMMGVTGAFYPAIDLGAGEKERGTIETLLISPATRSEILVGKFLTVLLFSVTTALLNLVSMGMTGKYTMSLFGSSRFGGVGDISLPPATSIAWVVVMSIPLCSLFSALSLAFAMFAKSNKEGQYYLTPLLMVTMGLAVVCLSPSQEISQFNSLIPVVGPSLLLKALLQSSHPSHEMSYYLVSVLLASIGYSAAALMWAVSLFKREEVLFREAERFDLNLWIRHVLRDKEPTPRAAEAVMCYFLMMVLQFASIGLFQEAMGSAMKGPNAAQEMLRLQMMSMAMAVLAPPVVMTLVLTTNFRRTLKLYWPKPIFLLFSVLLPFALIPVANEVLQNLKWFFPKPPSSAFDIIKAMGSSEVPVVLALLAGAVFPAVCEEVAFRGFILTGWQRSYRGWAAITMSSIAFGMIHMIPHQVFNAVFLGFVLGLLAVRSGSLLPGIIFHFLFNATQLLRLRVRPEWFDSGITDWLFTTTVHDGKPMLDFDLPLIAIAGLASVYMVYWLYRMKNERPEAAALAEPSHPETLASVSQ